MLHPFNTLSFLSIWYWAFTVLVWTLVTHRVLGVPHDMLLRAARLPEVAARVDTLAHIAADRARGLAESAGVALAALAGFCLAMLAVLGFVFGVELARALVPLAFPLALVAALTARLAARVRAEGLRGEPLRRLLSRHRARNQGVAILAMFAAAVLAVTEPAAFFPR
ncbi:MAG: component of SufBCD complex [Rhodovulum sulfidophilum]|uniref:Component of SufBCD complex n=1 Tax=Rhodovulum sulfidophilum TaxID=35806 RepID=A0A2W5NEL6_RHOSU|nr:MAG: component of SufBCD complex [Rhodovulum sulfidophilum]